MTRRGAEGTRPKLPPAGCGLLRRPPLESSRWGAGSPVPVHLLSIVSVPGYTVVVCRPRTSCGGGGAALGYIAACAAGRLLSC